MKFEEFNLSKNADGLLPVVVQDCETLKVLMVAYMNKEAFEKTCETGKATFYSRTRGALWTKGETSGNYIEVYGIFPDCDNDTLLLMGRPLGPTCHRGTVSCFDTPENEGFIRHLEGVIQRRHIEKPEGSYTTHLFNKGVNKIAQKVGEETHLAGFRKPGTARSSTSLAPPTMNSRRSPTQDPPLSLRLHLQRHCHRAPRAPPSSFRAGTLHRSPRHSPPTRTCPANPEPPESSH